MATDVSPWTGNRVVCLCRDCRAYAHYLGQSGILDEYGGTDIFQMTPSQVQIVDGRDHLCCMRLSEKGLTRWFAGCCKTPVGNTLRSARVAFVGVVHSFMDHAADGRSRDDVLGPPTFIQCRFAPNGSPPGGHPTAPPALIWKSVRLFVSAWAAGKNRPSPFFDPSTGAPVAKPVVLTAEERRRLV